MHTRALHEFKYNVGFDAANSKSEKRVQIEMNAERTLREQYTFVDLVRRSCTSDSVERTAPTIYFSSTFSAELYERSAPKNSK